MDIDGDDPERFYLIGPITGTNGLNGNYACGTYDVVVRLGKASLEQALTTRGIEVASNQHTLRAGLPRKHIFSPEGYEVFHHTTKKGIEPTHQAIAYFADFISAVLKEEGIIQSNTLVERLRDKVA